MYQHVGIDLPPLSQSQNSCCISYSKQIAAPNLCVFTDSQSVDSQVHHLSLSSRYRHKLKDDISLYMYDLQNFVML